MQDAIDASTERSLFLSSIALETGLKCKKCGYDRPRRINYAGGGYRCSCVKCGYCTKIKLTYDEALAAWNQR